MKTFNPKKVAVTYNGVPITGFAKGSFIEADQNTDTFTLDVGSDGEAARTQSADESGNVKLTLMQTSSSNDYLSGRHSLDRKSAAGTGVLQIEDTSGPSGRNTVILLPEAWLRKPATVTLADGSQGREWTFDTGKIDMKIGGN